ncbi:MAG: type II toxin-antitoxin system VapC family toxin [Patescibacteria group bacterium]
MRRIFVDSSFWYALAARGDVNHERSALLARHLQTEGACLYTSVLVIAETQRLIMHRFGVDAGRRYLRQIMIQAERGFLSVLAVSPPDLHLALDLMQKYAEHDLSLTDACSAILMHRHRIEEAASFDLHFRLLGFTILPG